MNIVNYLKEIIQSINYILSNFLIVYLLCSLLACRSEVKTHYDFFEDGSIKTSYKAINDNIILITDYHPNNNVKNIRTVVNGYLKGISEDFNTNGLLNARTKWLNGKQNGLSYYYYPSGNLKQIVRYQNDNKKGIYYEYFDQSNSQVHYKIKYIIVRDKSYPNEIYEYGINGGLVTTSPIIKINYTINYTKCLAKLTFKLENPNFPRIRVYIGGFDSEFNLKDSTLSKEYDSKNLTASFEVSLPDRKDTVFRGVLSNYKIMETSKNRIVKHMVKDLYWSLLVKSCKKPASF